MEQKMQKKKKKQTKQATALNGQECAGMRKIMQDCAKMCKNVENLSCLFMFVHDCARETIVIFTLRQKQLTL